MFVLRARAFAFKLADIARVHLPSTDVLHIPIWKHKLNLECLILLFFTVILIACDHDFEIFCLVNGKYVE